MWAYQAALQTLILLRRITAGDVAKGKPRAKDLEQKRKTTMFATSLTLQAATMATKPLTLAACGDICQPSDEKDQADFRPLHMNWAMVTDTDGNRLPQMCWRAN